ncbi:MAG TPA: phosphate ABC transporter permease PstA, partial [Candidatus Binatia bacterium]|nr:phosphate ABC transporter permease PstA [Candidatus Binatia bacterium]
MDKPSATAIEKSVAGNKTRDKAFAIVGLIATFVGMLTLAALLFDLASDGLARIKPHFFTSFPSRFPGQAGILSAWVGTILVMIVTALAAIPIGIGAGIYLEEYAAKNWLTALIEINIANLAGVPSIVYGLMALGLFVYQFKFGQSILSAGLTLALLILPIIIVATRESLRAVPASMREAAYALGATKWQTTSD